jgi:uncharacterized membrane protein YbhN (UPF0104 family)
VSLLVLGVVLGNLDWAESRSLLRQASPRLLGGAVLLVLTNQVLLAVALWWMLRTKGHDLSIGWVIWTFLTSHFAGSLLPSGAGVDMVRAYYLSRRTRHLFDSVSAVVILKLLGNALLMSIGLATLVMAGDDLLPPRTRLLAVGFCATVLAVVVTVLLSRPRRALVALLSRSRFLSVHRGASKAVESLDRYTGPTSSLLPVAGLSLVVQLNAVLLTFLIARSIDMACPFHAFTAFVPIVRFLATLPVSIGGLGVREGSYAFLLGQMPGGGVPVSQAVMLSLSLFLIPRLFAVVGAAMLLIHPPSRRRTDDRST